MALGALLALALAPSACRETARVDDGVRARVARVTVTPPVDTLAPGEAALLRAAPQDSAGRELARAAVLWSSSAPDVAVVDETGRVRALAPGSTLIAAVADGVRGEARVLVRRRAVSLTVAPSSVAWGESIALQPVLRDSSGVVIPAAVTLVSRDVTILAPDTLAFGPTANRMTARRMGTATVAATVDGRELTAQVTVGAPRVAHVGFVFRDLVVPVGATRPLDVGIFVAGAGSGVTGDPGRIELPVEWRTSDSSVVTVDAQGIARAHRAGQAVVTAVVNGIAGAVGVRALAYPDSRLAFTQIAVGERQTCALSTGGTVYCWGESPSYARGRLGLAVPEETIYLGAETWSVASLPLPVRSPVRFATLAVSSAARGGCALTAAGEAYCWNSAGGARAVAPGIAFDSLSLSARHACGVARDGVGWCWGTGAEGALGTGRAETDDGGVDPLEAPPRRVAGDERWSSIVTGLADQLVAYSCGVTVEGALSCWGGRQLAPTPVAPGRRFRSVTTGGQTCAIAADGPTYCWYGVRPTANLESHRVDGGLRFVVAAARERDGCGIVAGGATYCWSTVGNERGAPQLLAPAPPFRTLVFSVSYAPHACALSLDHVAYCWGVNDMGQLGLPRLHTWSRIPGSTRPLAFQGTYPLPTKVMGQP